MRGWCSFITFLIIYPGRNVKSIIFTVLYNSKFAKILYCNSVKNYLITIFPNTFTVVNSNFIMTLVLLIKVNIAVNIHQSSFI